MNKKNTYMNNILNVSNINDKEILEYLYAATKAGELEKFREAIEFKIASIDIEKIQNPLINSLFKYLSIDSGISEERKEKIIDVVSKVEKNLIGSAILYILSLDKDIDIEVQKKLLGKSQIYSNQNLSAWKNCEKTEDIPVETLIELLKQGLVTFNDIEIEEGNSNGKINFIPLGGGDEVGRSAYLLEIDGYKLLIDAGINMNSEDKMYPNFKYLVDNDLLKEIDYVIITHAHLDHCGAIIELYKLNEDIKFIFTKDTKELIKANLKDFGNLRQGNILDFVLSKSIVLDYKKEFFIKSKGIKISLYRAGHILGAASILIESKYSNIFFTGDFTLTDRETVKGLDLPKDIKIDILITETTYGNKHEANEISRSKKELKDYVKEAIKAGKSLLFPCFAIGRTQDLVLILKEIMNEENSFRIYIDGKSSEVTKLYNKLLMYNVDGKKIYYVEDSEYSSRKDFINFEVINEPCCIVSSSGMLLEGSASADYAKHMLGEKNCVCIMSGYQASGTPGEYLKSQIEYDLKYFSIDGESIRVNAELKTFNLSAHADVYEILALELKLKAEKIILIHGDYKGNERILNEKLDGIRKVKVFQSINNKMIKIGE